MAGEERKVQGTIDIDYGDSVARMTKQSEQMAAAIKRFSEQSQAHLQKLIQTSRELETTLAASVKDIRPDLQAAVKDIRQLSTAMKQLSSNVRRTFRRSAASTQELVSGLNNVRGAIRSTARSATQINTAARNIRKLGEATNKAFSAERLRSMADDLGIIALAIGGIVTAGAKLADQEHAFTAQFKVITGSAEGAKQVMDEIAQSANKFGLNLSEAYQLIRALSAENPNVTKEIDQWISRAARLKLTNPLKSMSEAARAIAEYMAGQRVTLQRVFNVPSTLIDEARKYSDDLGEQLDYILAKLNVTEQAALEVGNSFEGALNRFINSVQRRFAPAFDFLKAKVGELINFFSGLFDVIAAISPTFSSAAVAFGGVIAAISPFLFVGGRVIALLKSMRDYGIGASGAMGKLAKGFQAATVLGFGITAGIDIYGAISGVGAEAARTQFSQILSVALGGVIAAVDTFFMLVQNGFNNMRIIAENTFNEVRYAIEKIVESVSGQRKQREFTDSERQIIASAISGGAALFSRENEAGKEALSKLLDVYADINTGPMQNFYAVRSFAEQSLLSNRLSLGDIIQEVTRAILEGRLPDASLDELKEITRLLSENAGAASAGAIEAASILSDVLSSADERYRAEQERIDYASFNPLSGQDIEEYFNQSLSKFTRAMGEMFGVLPSEQAQTETQQAIEDATSRQEIPITEAILNQWLQLNDDLTALDQKLVDGLRNSFIKLGEDLRKATEDYNKKRADLIKKHNDKQAQAQAEFSRSMRLMAEDHARALRDVQIKLDDDIAKLREKSRRDQIKAEKDKNKELQKLWEDFKLKLRESAMKLDAMGIWRAMMDFRKRRREITQDTEERKAEIQEETRLRIEEMRKEAEARKNSLIEEYNIRKQRATEEYNIRRQLDAKTLGERLKALATEHKQRLVQIKEEYAARNEELRRSIEDEKNARWLQFKQRLAEESEFYAELFNLQERGQNRLKAGFLRWISTTTNSALNILVSATNEAKKAVSQIVGSPYGYSGAAPQYSYNRGGRYLSAFATGSGYVRDTGTYLLHRGEAVIPSAQAAQLAQSIGGQPTGRNLLAAVSKKPNITLNQTINIPQGMDIDTVKRVVADESKKVLIRFMERY